MCTKVRTSLGRLHDCREGERARGRERERERERERDKERERDGELVDDVGRVSYNGPVYIVHINYI